jgi:acyl-coenzyme A thioesterase PaaI-like protein
VTVDDVRSDDVRSAGALDGFGPGVANPDETRTAVEAVRRLIAAARIADAPADVLARVTELTEEAAALLEEHAVEGMRMQGALIRGDEIPRRSPGELDGSIGDLAEPAMIFPYSPIIGLWNPISPAASFEWDGERVTGTATFGDAYVGPPNMVHGGIIALLFDELLGMANVCSGVGAFTGTLEVRYEKPTPLHGALELEGSVDRVEGRKVISVGTITHGGQVTARAEGVFIRVDL